MENIHANAILQGKMDELRNLVGKLDLNEGSEELSVLYWQIEKIASQTREYLKILNLYKDYTIFDMEE